MQVIISVPQTKSVWMFLNVQDIDLDSANFFSTYRTKPYE